MIFALLVHDAPVGRHSSQAAYRFAHELLASGHALFRVFFFADGVHNSTRLNISQGNETDLPLLWSRLAAEHGVDLVSCVGSGLRRGIIDAAQARQHGIEAASLREGFELSGLGQLVEANIRCDRIVVFGG